MSKTSGKEGRNALLFFIFEIRNTIFKIMEIGQRVILVRPERECHKNCKAEIVDKLISKEGVNLYRVKIEGQRCALPRWASDDDLQIAD